jgi:hypothetical protein
MSQWKWTILCFAASAAGALPARAADWHCHPGATDAAPLLAFAGWTVPLDAAQHWAGALAEAGWRPGAVGDRCAVRGPAKASFKPADIDTEALAAERAAAWALGTAPITVVAHSSGAFVAHRVLQHWRDQGHHALLRRVRYFNLDGDMGSGPTALDRDLISRLDAVLAVSARDPVNGDQSTNAAAMSRLAALAPGAVQRVVVDASGSGCNPGAAWCLHQVLVTQRPHNPAGFDLLRDYGRIGPERPVQAAYLR